MAEIIQERIEDRLPELEQLERVGLFSHAEIKAIIKKASDLEYKIQRRALFKEDFINYVQYEINLLELIQRRRIRIGYSFKKDEIENSIVHRVQGVFRRASAKWKATKVQLSKVFSAMLAIHSNKPALWIMAAKWEMEDRLSSESARQLFLRALRFHPECPKLYQEYFRMELMNTEKLRKEKQEFERADMEMETSDYPEEILKGELARIIYKNSINIIKGAEFHVSLLSIAQLFDFAKDLQKEIYDDLQALHTDDPLTWDYVARRELEIQPEPGEEQPAVKQSKAVEVGRKEERCCAVYEEAVKALPTEAMWKCYINFCLERFTKKTSSTLLKGKRLQRTMTAFRKAHELRLLPEFQCKQWIELLLHHKFLKEALEVAVAGTELFRDSGTMWQMKLKVLINSKSPDIAMVFEEAFAHLKSQKALLAVIGANSVTLKEKYLDWAYRSGGCKKARAVFKSGAQSIANDSPAHGEGTRSEEEGFAVDEEESDGEPDTWELSEGTHCPPREQTGDLFSEDWDLELKADQGNPYDADDIQGSLSQEIKPWVCCAPQGDLLYDPSWHHPPPLIPHYSKMVFETGQFDDAED
ncbi:U3 small nucleolar RNA-associated protein 6 like protein [Tupaia chinensis]|uniref:U3 small nucleolar RNA-associated protein 6 like protein n=1 Tax=Tupaia chinensis TaxID=246437 RepID=L9KH03_TUPCH|nr:U3 small nucleolar RNA-associated protein 6 like protein [Tupaia chinensis]